MKRKEQVFNYEEFNSLLDRIEKCSIVLYGKTYEDRDPKKQSLGLYSFVKFNPKLCTITTRYGPEMKPITYVFTRDDTVAHLKSGSEEFGVFMRAAKEYIPDYSNDQWTIKNLGKGKHGTDDEGKFLTKNAGIQKYNDKFLSIKTYAYEYDLNSAYLSVLYRHMPDTRNPIYGYQEDRLREGYVGFVVTDKLILIDKPGAMVDIQFPLIETPTKIKEYCERWFERCRDKSKKLNSKHQIVDSIGYLQYYNPYVRAFIIESCNNYILSLTSKEHTILVNTDALFSDIPLDLDIGTNIGQFKLKEGFITISGLDYDSDDFGDVHRGQQKNNYYDVINNRLVRIKADEEE